MTSTPHGSNSFSDIVGLSVTITPKSTGSKILLLCNISLSCSDDATGRSFRCLRNGTHIGGGSDGSRKSVNFFASPMSTDQNMSGTTSWHYLDSPSSTSALTYKIQMTGWKCEFDFEVSLQKTIEWYLKNKNFLNWKK